ncbi:MAG: SRPBCC family protein [Thermomicrobiales bacterium]|nr:SRPBCC family protein [Thermomicrobiales bacterium]
MTVEGVLITIDDRHALQFVRRYRQPIDRVWRAVTEPEQMAQWFPSQVIGDRTPGATLIFDDSEQRAEAIEAGEPTRADGPQFTGTVIDYDPPRLFSFTWGSEIVEIALHNDGNETVMTFTQFLSHSSIAARNGSGWHACLHSLDALLGTAGGDIDFEPLYDDYLSRMGPSLGVPATDGSMIWERGTHVDAEKIRSVTSNSESFAEWGAAAHANEPIEWSIEPQGEWTLFRLKHAGIGKDAELAAAWHALLLQLDMYLAADFLMPADPSMWIDAYRNILT